MYESYATVWERVAKATPDAAAVVQGERRLSWGELGERATRLAAALAEMGVTRDTKVALFLYNCPEYLECLFALSALRAVPVNVNFRYLGDELAFLVDNADTTVVVFHESLSDRVTAARARMPRVHTFVAVDDSSDAVAASPLPGAHRYETLVSAHDPLPPIPRSGDDLLLWYTGGTTGRPKGVLWHQGTLMGYGLIASYALHDEPIANTIDGLIADVQRWHRDGTQHVALLTTPLTHATAVHQANSTLTVGGRIVLLERGHTDGDMICATIARERPNVLEIVGDVILRRVVRALEAAEARGAPYDISSLQRVHNSGAMVSPELNDALLSRGTMHIYDSLGASEGVGFGVALSTMPGEAATARFTLGPNARVLDERGRAIAAGSGEAGILAVHTSCGIGYYNDPERTATTFPVVNGVQYAAPGDWAVLHADGTLTLLGRNSHCINTGGEKVWPEEVEEALKGHPAVSDAAVVGVPDDEWGELVGAVVAISRHDDAPAPTAADLSTWVGTKLAGYKRPRRVVLVDEVQRNSVGKLDYEWAREVLT